jgi:hypothetical protein
MISKSKVLNPNTGRYVSKKGKIGKKISEINYKSKSRKIGRRTLRRSSPSRKFKRTGFNSLSSKRPFTSSMNNVLNQLYNDTSPRGKFILETIQEDYHNLKNMQDLQKWIRYASDLYDKN